MIYMRVEVFTPKYPNTPRVLLQQRLLGLSNGLTLVPMSGQYVPTPNAAPQIEDGVIITCFVEDTPVNRDIVESLGMTYKEEARQSTVLLVINGSDAHFI